MIHRKIIIKLTVLVVSRSLITVLCGLTGLIVLVGCAGSTGQGAPGAFIVAKAPVPPAPYFSTAAPVTSPRESLNTPVTVALSPEIPAIYARPLLSTLLKTAEVQAANGPQPLIVLDQLENARALIRFTSLRTAGIIIAERFFAVVAPFATVQDEVTFAELQQRWLGQEAAPLLVTEEAAALSTQLGTLALPTVPVDDLVKLLEGTPGALGIVPFDQLDPRLKVLTVDGVNLLDNRLDPLTYPLALALIVEGKGATILGPLLQPVAAPFSNRDATQLTTLMMTGVTAMARATAAKMEQKGVLFPAEIISATLAAADITHVSNEIPFLEDCVVNNTVDNLTLCSHTSYWETLEAIGTDIVGLSGNHVNDFGRAGARESLQFYKDNQIPIYGSGFTIDEACAPLFWEHNGNTFAFIAVLAFGPSSAWVTEEEPGACYYYDHKDHILADVRKLSTQVDIVAIELQYLETYNPFPTDEQVIEFRELRDAGADIVTGVQSHVPQAVEPYGATDMGGPGVIAYGLGNLFFDQMWSWETRTELYIRHTIYQGRVLSTEILTGVLEEYAQPRWATPDERAEILNRIFDGAPRR